MSGSVISRAKLCIPTAQISSVAFRNARNQIGDPTQRRVAENPATIVTIRRSRPSGFKASRPVLEEQELAQMA